jgi:hypothetical protein
VCSILAAPAKRARGGGKASGAAATAAARAAGLCSSDEEGGDDDDDDAWLNAGLTDAPAGDGTGQEDAPPLPPPPPAGRVCQAPQLYSADVEGESLAGARARRLPSRSRHFSDACLVLAFVLCVCSRRRGPPTSA